MKSNVTLGGNPESVCTSDVLKYVAIRSTNDYCEHFNTHDSVKPSNRVCSSQAVMI